MGSLDAAQFMSEFQKMRTMMSRMSEMMGPGGAPGGMDPAMEGANMDMLQMPGANRALRRSSKKKKKSGKGGGGGFGQACALCSPHCEQSRLQNECCAKKQLFVLTLFLTLFVCLIF
jgi:hypothetical protein